MTCIGPHLFYLRAGFQLSNESLLCRNTVETFNEHLRVFPGGTGKVKDTEEDLLLPLNALCLTGGRVAFIWKQPSKTEQLLLSNSKQKAVLDRKHYEYITLHEMLEVYFF